MAIVVIAVPPGVIAVTSGASSVDGGLDLLAIFAPAVATDTQGARHVFTPKWRHARHVSRPDHTAAQAADPQPCKVPRSENHQDRDLCGPFAIGDDRGLVLLAVAAEDEEEFGFATRCGPLSRREAGFGELAFDQAKAAPHDVGLRAAVGIALVAVGATEAVVIGRPLEKLCKSGGFVAR